MLPAPWTVPLDPLLIVSTAAPAALVLRARSKRRRDGLEARTWPAAAGVALLAATWLSPLETLGAHYLLTAHLVQITLVMGVVPPLLLLGLPLRWPGWGHPRLRRLGRAALHPATAMVAINATFFLWHLGPVYEAAMRTPELYAVEQVSLLVVSLVFWWPIVAPGGGQRVLSRWHTLGYILVATIPQTFAGITVALARHALYPSYAAAPRVLGLSVMTDQQIAGACLALVSKLALFAAFAVIFMRLLNESPADEGDDGGGGWRRPGRDTPSPQPSGSLGWLADLNAGRTVPEPVPARARVKVSSPAGAASRPE